MDLFCSVIAQKLRVTFYSTTETNRDLLAHAFPRFCFVIIQSASSVYSVYDTS